MFENTRKVELTKMEVSALLKLKYNCLIMKLEYEYLKLDFFKWKIIFKFTKSILNCFLKGSQYL